MAQHDYVIANGTGAAVRSDLNNGLAAIVSQNSGPTEPATMYAYQWWADTTTGLLKIRNAANNAWVTVGTLASANLGLLSSGSTVTAALGSASTPGITFTGDLNTGVYSPGADQVAISTSGAQRLLVDASGNITASNSISTTISSKTAEFNAAGGSIYASFNDGTKTWRAGAGIISAGLFTIRNNTDALNPVNITSAGLVGIGTTSPQRQLHVANTGTTYIRVEDSTNSVRTEIVSDSTGGIIGTQTSHSLAFNTGNTERARIDSSGRLLVGTSTDLGGGISNRKLQVASDNGGFMVISRDDSSIVSGDPIGAIEFIGRHGGNTGRCADIFAYADADHGTNDYPGRLVFSTTADGASSPTERMRLDSSGTFFVGKTTTDVGVAGASIAPAGQIRAIVSGNYSMIAGRLNNDGDLIQFWQDSVNEGSISVSGTTVSYNGAHLSRWSQLPSGAERTEILRGSVLSNIDEMCEWGDEENEQLNRMKVSDVEGDKNVSGVFQGWDDDDDTYTNDFYCAMTGDFIIRIGAGVTVERGDLLMSAGDGTAKPQGDGYVQDKTIAKVTSTNVSCTYDDGSYCVPCVLMAC